MSVADPRYGGGDPSPSQLSRYLRTGDDPDLRGRRRLVGLSLLGAAMGQVVTAYQTGLVHHLPDPPVGPFDSDRVDASDYGYQRLRTPDGLLMIGTYALTAGLAGAGGQDRARHQPWLPLLMAGKIASDVATNMMLAREEWSDNHALCAYCQTANVLSWVSLAVALPEARRAWQSLRGRG